MLDLLEFAFFQRALIGGVFIAFVAPLIGTFIVLRRLSLIGDTLAHVSIAGVALGFLINIYPLFIGVLFSLLGAIAIEYLRRMYKSYAELSIAIIMSSGIALASVLFTLGRGFNMDVQSFLFGNILTLNNQDIGLIAVVAIVVSAVTFSLLKELFVVTFDEDAASVSGLPVKVLNFLLTIMTALVISAAIKIVGALLVSAMLTIPVACSLTVSRSFKQTVWLSIAFAELAVIGGLLIAAQWDLAPGGTVVLLLVGLLLSCIISRRVLHL